MIRSLEAQLTVTAIQIEDLINKKAPWSEIEQLMNKRDELVILLNKLKSAE